MPMTTTTSIIRWFGRILWQVRLQSFINMMSGVVRVGLDFTFIWATKRAIDIATGTTQGQLTHAAVLLIAIMVAQMALGYLGRWIAALLGVEAQNRMQRHFFEHLLRSEWHGREARHSGDVINRLVSDANTVVSIMTDTVPQALAVSVRLIAAFFFLYSMDDILAVAVVLIMPVFVGLSRIYIKRMRAITRQVRQTDSLIQSTLQESIQHRLVLKTLERVETMSDTLARQQTQLRQQVRQRTLFSSTSNLVLNIGFGGAYLFTFLWSVYHLNQGAISFGMMTAFMQLCGQIQGPFREMTRFIPAIIGSFTAAERLMELEAMPQEDDGAPIRFDGGAGVRIEDVSYAYDAHSRRILDGLNLDCPPGSSTAILGETGAGKTTLICLILALLRPDSGRVVMYAADGSRTTPVSARTRCNIVYVPQGNSLFSGTIRWNLLMGNPEATDDDLRQALSMACADFVEALPDGLDTVIGEGGAGLSEGQAQRIAVARALLRRGNILLLDEATSALDQQTEANLISNLLNHHASLAVRPTLIFITHRPAVVAHCTQVVTLNRISK